MVRHVLAKVKGIGLETADRLCHQNGILPTVRMHHLNEARIEALNKSIAESGLLTEQKLVQDIRNNIERLKSIECYRGIRHVKRLPVRGQRTHTNSKTARKMPH